MAFTMSETEDDDSDGRYDFDDDHDNVEDDPGNSTSDSDAVKEISSSALYLTINGCAKAIHELLFVLGCCIYTFNSLSCQIIACFKF